MSSITYSSDNNIAVRCYNHARLGLQKDIQKHDPNLMEKFGNIGLWPLENLPRMTLNAITDPRVVTIALTSLAMLADSYGFYPEETTAGVQAAWALLPTVPFWTVKFATYIATIETIGSYGMRAEGRFINKELMGKFYGENKDNHQD